MAGIIIVGLFLELIIGVHSAMVPVIGITGGGQEEIEITDNSATQIGNLFNPAVTEITNFPVFPVLATISWTPGHLTHFPNLYNVSGSLTVLNLDQNNIHIIQPTYLEALSNLQMLYLKDNQIAYFPETTTPMVLQWLYLDSNPLTAMPVFGTLQVRMTQLSLKGSQLSEINPNLQTFPNLFMFLDLQNCQLDTVPPCELFPAAMGITVKLGGNPLKTFDPYGMDMTCVDFREGFVDSAFTTIPNFCRAMPLPDPLYWVPVPFTETLYIPCDCTSLWIKVGLILLSLQFLISLISDILC